MALRTIRTDEDEVLRKKAKVVKEITPRVKELVEDMIETMNDANGVGLAAPQVGILKRIVVIDVGEGPIVMINPEIIETSGEQDGLEGCLSIPNRSGYVKRPMKVKAKATDLEGNEFHVEGEELLARAICHELDHLEGVLYTDLASKMIKSEEEVE